MRYGGQEEHFRKWDLLGCPVDVGTQPLLLAENREAWELWAELHADREWADGAPVRVPVRDMLARMDVYLVDPEARESLVRRLRALETAWLKWYSEEREPPKPQSESAQE